LPCDDAVLGEPRDELVRRLPAPQPPQGCYLPAAVHATASGVGGQGERVGGLVMTAGMTPRVDGVLRHRGRVGHDLTVGEARDAAAVAAANALSAAVAALAPGQRLDRVIRVTVYVNAGTEFEEHTAVADGASVRLRELLGERGTASRAAVGVSSLPGGACVEVELTCSWWALP
jgi:enamine deaminase RidA (YjgF/YER057c/UK114 family)